MKVRGVAVSFVIPGLRFLLHLSNREGNQAPPSSYRVVLSVSRYYKSWVVLALPVLQAVPSFLPFFLTFIFRLRLPSSSCGMRVVLSFLLILGKDRIVLSFLILGLHFPFLVPTGTPSHGDRGETCVHGLHYLSSSQWI